MPPLEDLPNDVTACHALIAEQARLNWSLAQDYEKLKGELEQLKRMILGRRSERHIESSSAQLSLFEQEPAAQAAESAVSEAVTQEITYRRKVRSKADRFPENLPREVRVIDVPQAQRLCPCCGEEMPVIDTDIRERLEYMPAKLVVHELHYPKRACGACKQTVAVAEPPSADQAGAALTAGSRYGFGVTAQIILGKYADHLPLYRLQDVFARAGVEIPRSTQVDLLDAAADLIDPLYRRIQQRLLSSSVLGMDDTPVRLQDPSLPGRMRTGRIWLCRGREEAP